jgi:small subunit ribosomal protein S16
MLKIRLRRMGAKHRPFYRIVVSDSRSTPTSRFNEILGTYDPSHDPADVKIDLEKADEWLRKGAHPSETVARLIDRARRESTSDTA